MYYYGNLDYCFYGKIIMKIKSETVSMTITITILLCLFLFFRGHILSYLCDFSSVLQGWYFVLLNCVFCSLGVS